MFRDLAPVQGNQEILDMVLSPGSLEKTLSDLWTLVLGFHHKLFSPLWLKAVVPKLCTATPQGATANSAAWSGCPQQPLLSDSSGCCHLGQAKIIQDSCAIL